MEPTPLAYFLTWTCYGAWLHGDSRGSVDYHHNTPGTPVNDSDPVARSRAVDLMKWPAVTLDEPMRLTCRQTIEDHCRFRAWVLHAVHVRSNHIHVVISCGTTPPDRAVNQFKSWCTRRLREARSFAPDRPVWTEGGSTRYLWREFDVAEAVRYVQDGQGLPLNG